MAIHLLLTSCHLPVSFRHPATSSSRRHARPLPGVPTPQPSLTLHLSCILVIECQVEPLARVGPVVPTFLVNEAHKIQPFMVRLENNVSSKENARDSKIQPHRPLIMEEVADLGSLYAGPAFFTSPAPRSLSNFLLSS